MNLRRVIFVVTPQTEGISHNRAKKGPSYRFFFGNGIHDLPYSRLMMAQAAIIDHAPCQEFFKE
jgi:hypothetical protein